MDSATVIAVLSLLISFLSLLGFFYTLYTTRKDKQPRLGIGALYFPSTPDGPTLLVAINNHSAHRTQLLDPLYLSHRSATPDQNLPIGSIIEESVWIDPGEMKYFSIQLDSNLKHWLDAAINENKNPFVAFHDGKMNWYKSNTVDFDDADSLQESEKPRRRRRSTLRRSSATASARPTHGADASRSDEGH